MSLLKSSPPKAMPLEDRIAALRAEIDAYIDARITEIRKTCEGVPAETIRQSLTRGMGCQCATYLELKARDEAEAQRGAA
jgi:hypothetical protein